MSNTNTICLIGRITRDTEFGFTSAGSACARFSLANNYYSNGKNEVSYFDIVLFGKVAESLKPYLTKGSLIGVTGRLKQNRWTSQDGKNNSKIQIIATNIELLGGDGKKESGENENQYGNPLFSTDVNAEMPPNDEIPFE